MHMYERRVKCVYSVLIDKHIVSSAYMDEYWINILFVLCTSVHVIGTYRTFSCPLPITVPLGTVAEWSSSWFRLFRSFRLSGHLSFLEVLAFGKIRFLQIRDPHFTVNILQSFLGTIAIRIRFHLKCKIRMRDHLQKQDFDEDTHYE